MKTKLILLLFGMAITSFGLRAENDPLVGVWKLDLARCKFSPGPPLQSQTNKYEPSPDGIKMTAELVDARAEKRTEETIYVFDGKERPVPGSSTGATFTDARTEPNMVERYGKGGPGTTGIFITRHVVSRDGKTLTVTQIGKDNNSQLIDNILVFTKQ